MELETLRNEGTFQTKIRITRLQGSSIKTGMNAAAMNSCCRYCCLGRIFTAWL